MVSGRRWRLLGGWLLALWVLTVAVDEVAEVEQEDFMVAFNNFWSRPLELRRDDGTAEWQRLTEVAPMSKIVGRAFEGQRFKLVDPAGGGGSPTVASVFVMERGRQSYVLPPLAEDREHPAYLEFLEEQAEASKISVADQLDELHSRGELHAVSLLSRARPKAKPIAMGISIINFRAYRCDIYWDNGSPGGVLSGQVGAMSKMGGITTYPGEKLIVKGEMPDGKFKVLGKLVMDFSKRVYVVKPEEGDTSARRSPLYRQYKSEAKVEKDYVTRTGLAWLGSHPPSPATLPMYAAGSSIGQVAHTVNVRGLQGPRDLVALSWNPSGPRAFFIGNVLTPEECAHIVQLAQDRLRLSTIGSMADGKKGHETETRSSKMAFINRKVSPMLETVHEKFADILNVSDSQLRKAAEDLQVVRYELGQEYLPHYDYMGQDDADRLATLLVYLGDDGGTVFPRAHDDRGMVVAPKMGDAVLFYSQLPDGNLDELSLHGGLPVVSGTKWVCNVWMHSHDRPWRSSDRVDRVEL